MPLCVTFLLCFWEVQYGIMAGVLVSGILLLYSMARPPVQVGFTPHQRCTGQLGSPGSWERLLRTAGHLGARCF